MSCYQYIEEYAQALTDKSKDNVLDEALQCFAAEEDARTRELQSFIDDFVQSREYAAYVEQKRSIVKRSTGTQCSLNEIMVETQKRGQIEKYPLTEEQKKMHAFKISFEKYSEQLEMEETIRKQKRSIQIIKAKINQAKKIFECTREAKRKEKQKADQELLQKYSTKFNINLIPLSSAAQAKLLQRFRKCEVALTSKTKQKQTNIVAIIEKLVTEYKFQKDQLFLPKEYIVKKNEKIIEGLEVVGTKIQLIEAEKLITPAKSDKEVEAVAEPKEETKKGKTKKIAAKENKKPKAKKAEKKGNKKGIKEKKAKPSAKLVLPDIPIVNPRTKIFPENIDEIVDLLEEFKTFDDQMENRDMQLMEDSRFNEDKGLQFKPRELLFESYEQDKSYYKTMSITNVSQQIRKVRFQRFDFSDEYDQVVFKIEEFGICKLFTGCNVSFYVNFQPYDEFKAYDGNAVFLSYDVRSCQYYQSEIRVRCLPKYSQLHITPGDVNFGNIPIWKTDGGYEHFKVLKFQNKGTKACTVSIRKIFDPLDLDYLIDSEEEGKENVAPSESDPVPVNAQIVTDILSECLRNLDNNFQFECGFLTLKAKQEKKVKVLFKNASYIGSYLEKYLLEVYECAEDGSLQLVGSQTSSLRGETTGHFLSTIPEQLDFGTCFLNSCYQVSFDVFNGSNITQAVSIKVPSSLVSMVRTDTSLLYLQPNVSRTIFVKFNPSEILTQAYCPYFDKSNLILEFPLRLYVVSKSVKEYPPVKVYVYAIMANFEDLTISCNFTRNLSNFLTTILIDVGDCSVYETIWTEIYVTNNTAVTQICGFTDLPGCTTLQPCYGFCKLKPGQRKKFKVYISPETQDFPSYAAGSLRNTHLFFKITVDTILNIGQIRLKAVASTKSIKESVSLDYGKNFTITDTEMFISMNGIVPSDLKQHSQFATATESMLNKEDHIISRMGSMLRTDFCPDSRQPSIQVTDSTTNREGDSVDTVLNYQNFLIVETNSRREVWLKINIKRPLLEFSHQFVEFPDTPPGSYSTMEVTLRAHDRDISKACAKKKSRLSYKAHFEILGGSDEILVQPSCQVLMSGESIKITLIAAPKIPKEIVEQTAKSLKYAQLYEQKLKDYHGKAKKGVAKKSKETKTAKGAKSKRANKVDSRNKEDEAKAVEAPQPDITIKDEELTPNYLDLYPAEMVYWRSLKPYYIKANFACVIDYETQKVNKKQDKLYLETICKVVRPDFITDLNQQKIDFGNCLIGMSATRTIRLQNITYNDIKPKVSLLNPTETFSFSYVADVTLPPEHFLNLPIVFRPSSTESVVEYFEIKSNSTTVPLILCGHGCAPLINVSPNFEVFRLETKPHKLAELQLKLENSSEASAQITFDKIFEIEAFVADLKAQKLQVDEKKKEKKKANNSNSLTDDEIESIGRCFAKTESGSHFELKTTKGSIIELQPKSHQSVSILCGEPDLIAKRKFESPKGKVKAEGKSQSAVSGTEGESKKSISRNDKIYITQYNIKLRQNHLKSILLLCIIKD